MSSPSRIWFGCNLALESDIWWQKFNDLLENQMTKFMQNFLILHRINYIYTFTIKTFVDKIDQ